MFPAGSSVSSQDIFFAGLPMSAIADGVDFFLNILSFDSASKPKASRPAISQRVSFPSEHSVLDRINRRNSSIREYADVLYEIEFLQTSQTRSLFEDVGG